MQKREAGLVIALDPMVLADCNKIICTGASLLNDSLDATLAVCPTAATIVLVGPTVGCFPDEIFARGIAAVAGTEIVDGPASYAALARGDNLGESSRRTLIRRPDYPGFSALLERAAGKG
jgi:uncharacterized protein (DUF4213/DUF364 family)